MYKKSLLSSIATTAIVLFNIQFNVHAESLKASGAEQEVNGETGKTYEIIHAEKGGKITGENLTVVGNKDTNKDTSEGENRPPLGSSSLESPAAVTTEDKGSIITLTGDKTTIKGTDSAIVIGVKAKDGGTISMTGGSINASDFGVAFLNTNGNNKLESVTISSGDDKTLLGFGIGVKDSTVTLKDVTIEQTENALSAKGDSTITITGGSFASKEATITASQNSGITIEGAQITSSDDSGLWAKDGGTISMTGGAIKTSYTGASFLNSNSDKNKLKDVEISSNENGKQINFGIKANKNSTVTLENVNVQQAENAIFADSNSKVKITEGSFASKEATIAASQNSEITIEGAQITSSDNSGLMAQNGGSISMNGGSINASQAGAYFTNSNSDKNKLKDVEISSNEGKTAILFGVKAENESKVYLEGVRFSHADSGISADNNSEITISKGEFDAKKVTIHTENGSTITLKDNTKVTSSNNVGLVAEQKSKIKMTGGEVTGKTAAIGAKKGGHITIENVSLTIDGADPVGNSDLITSGFGVFSEGKDSLIELTGDDTKIKNSIIGLQAKEDGAISMNGGSINASLVGVRFTESKNDKNKLKNVEISSNKENELLINGIKAEAESTVALENVNVKRVENAVVADSDSKIEITGGSFDAKKATIISQNGSTITINDSTITSSDDTGLWAKDDGVINMTGGTIKASNVGAHFENSKREENKLENVTISSVKDGDDALLQYGIEANKSTITLNNVTVTKAETAIIADDHSTITVSGGSFESKGDGIYAKQGSSISLNNATVTSYGENGVYADGQDSKIIMIGGSATTKNEHSSALLAKNKGSIDATDVTLTTDGIGTGALALGESTIQLHGNTTINNTLDGLRAADGGKITGENLNITGGKAITDPDTERSGLTTEGAGSEINLTGKTTIKNVDEGLYADGGSKITSGDLTIIGDESEKITTAVGSYEPESKIELNGNTSIKSFDLGLAAAGDASIIMKNGTKNEIDVKKIALSAAARGKIDLANTDVKAESIGMQLVALSKTNTDKDDLQIDGDNEINLTNSNIHVDNGTGILIGAFVEKNIENSPALSIGKVNLNNSEIHADVLLGNGVFWDKVSWKDKNVWNGKEVKDIANGSFTLNADHSILEGKANIAQERNVRFDLKNGTQWFLKNSTQEKDAEGNLLDITQRSRSDISILDLNDSSLIFQEPTEGHYHTLHIGSGKPDTQSVYNATGYAKIYFNTKWTDGTPITEQETDHLLIHGDVSGSTIVYIQSDLGDKESVINASDPSNIGGLSLIQVSGKADENSFKLAHGYITRGGSPYKYMLTGYGPESSYGQANIEQSLFDEKNENFWDFRLHKELLPDSGVDAPVAQMASYLVMPNALFYSGLTDMAEQNALLANIRTSLIDKGQEKQNGFFLHTYGSTGTFSSESAPRQYGYSGADLRYAALQGGVNFATLEGHNTTTRFGLLGTYGQLSFTPKDMQDAGKNTVDKWSLTAYGTIQYDNGFYLDTLLSYGFLKGEITNAVIGTTAKLKNAKMLNISTTVGKQFATGMQGVTFEPQAQVAYQHLAFDTILDADNFTIDMQNPHQWMIRVGGRLTKSITAENNHPMSFYGKVNLIKTFGDDQALHIDKDYKLDAMGAAIEGGLGISAQLSTNLSLHGDVSYQQKLQKTGISGASFSGGIRYQF
ncbi:autotransporter outer membrane beta-barrel domain-containing protein [Bartonella krasnovii]